MQLALETPTRQGHGRTVGDEHRAVSEDGVGSGGTTATGKPHWHIPASRATAVAQPQFMYLGVRCIWEACCSGRGAVDRFRYDMQMLDDATCRYTSNTVALVSGKHGICCDAEGELPLT